MGYIIGVICFIIGGCFGLSIMCVFTAAARADEAMIREIEKAKIQAEGLNKK